MREFALNKNGKCLSITYKNVNTKLTWKCSRGHEWEATPLNVLFNQTWCPECAGTKRKTINDMKDLATKKGGQCLSLQYKNNKTKLLWKCADGHKFEAAPNNVKNGWWCPYCNWYKNEEKCRFILELLLKTKFKKTRTLIKGFELDGYSQKFNLAFEYNGEQHYGLLFFKFTEDKLNKIKIQDIKKKEECKKRGINLLIIPYTETKNLENLVSFISNQIKILKISLAIDPNTISLETLPQSISAIKELNEIAQKRGGECLSDEYFNSQTKLLWKCEKGHIWTATPDSIKNSNSWCPVCAGREYTIDNMNEIAKKKRKMFIK